MQEQKVLFTVLPNGSNGGKLKLSVLVSPRLNTDEPSKTKLGSWIDFWNGSGHWPSRVMSLSFRFSFKGGAQKVNAVRTSPDPDPILWGKIFSAETYVKPFKFNDLSKRLIRSYPVMKVVNHVEGLYGKVAGDSPTSHPKLQGSTGNTLSEFINFFGEIDQNQKEFDAMDRQAVSKIKKDKSALQVLNVAALPGDPLKNAYLYALSFYDRPKPDAMKKYHRAPSAATLVEVPNRFDLPQVDFHQMLASTSDYPNIQRLLGIVIDFEIDPAGLVIPPSGEITLDSFSAGIFAGYNKNLAPARTNYKLNPEFLPAPKPASDSDIEDGYLKLDEKGKFALIQLDPDGTAQKTTNSGVNYNRMLQPRYKSFVTPKKSGLPTLRNAGLQVIRNERGMQIGARLQQVRANNDLVEAASAPVYWADDLLRGFRVDVKNIRTGKWFSLCRRIGTYQITTTGDTLVFDDEEGYIKSASATSSAEGLGDDIYLHERVFGWEGWSLTAPRPSKTIVSDFYEDTPDGKNRKAKIGGKERAEFSRNTDDYRSARKKVEFKVEATFRAQPGSLPRLRYGEEYEFRSRVVDVAGNSLPVKHPNWGHSLREFYRRLDPVGTPTIVPITAFGEGESLDHMVIRSNYNHKPIEYIEQQYVKDYLTGKWYQYAAANARFVAPPKTSQLIAEEHGMFDTAIGKGNDYQKGFNVACREEGTLLDQKIVDLTTGLKTITADGITMITPPSTPAPQKIFVPIPTPDPLPAPPAGKQYLLPGDPLAEGQYVVHATDRLILPYLPDPLARGAAFRGLPGVVSDNDIDAEVPVDWVPDTKPEEWVARVPFSGDWPEFETFRIQIEDGSGLPKWDKINRVLHVRLPQGDKAKVEYSSYMEREKVELMRLFHLIAPDRRERARLCAALGVHWMMTPYRTLELIHAVQQPLIAPSTLNSGGNRFISQKRPDGIGDTYSEMSGHIVLSTKSTGKIDILSDWEEPIDSLLEEEWRMVPHKAHVKDFTIPDAYIKPYPDELPVPMPPATNDDEKGLYELFRHEFGDTKYRKVNYYLKGTTRFREYFPVAMFNHPVNLPENDDEGDIEKLKHRMHRIGAKSVRHILNSARPAAPKILYIVPTFGWPTPERTPTSVVSRRCGNGLRVFLERPWFSSGDGELLGVVIRRGTKPLDGASGTDTKDPMKPFVTDWGMDPIWGSSKMAAQPKPSDFLGVEKIGTGLTLDELPGAAVDVVGYKVEFDKERGLWFADIEIDAGDSYFPFVRLALCRYQPNSIQHCHLSRVVMTDFAQLTPDRVAAVTFASASATKFKVMVSGVYGVNQMTKTAAVGAALPIAGSKPPEFPNLDLSRVIYATVEKRATIQAIKSNEYSAAFSPWHVHTNETLNVELLPTKQYDSRMIWMAEMTLQEPPMTSKDVEYRLQIREYEVLPTDPDVGQKITRFSNDYFVNHRLVYADTILLRP
jgi:hypothetical protein